MKCFMEVFCEMYIEKMMQKHADNSAWATEEQTVENLGGMEAIESLYYLWSSVSNEGQTRCIGFNYDDVKLRLAANA